MALVLSSVLLTHCKTLTDTPFPISLYRIDSGKIWSGESATVEIPHKQWTLVIGYDYKARKWTVTVNGQKLSDLPEASNDPENYPEFCKSSEHTQYSENIRYVTEVKLWSISSFCQET